MDQEIKTRLKKCKNLKEVFDILDSTYNLETAKLGYVSSELIISGIVKAVEILKPEKK
jgi:hypothetical protein